MIPAPDHIAFLYVYLTERYQYGVSTVSVPFQAPTKTP